MILAIFALQVTPMLPTKFRVNWPFGSGEETKNRFSIAKIVPIQYPRCRYLGYWIGTILANSDLQKKGVRELQVTPMLPNKFRVDLPFS